MKKQKITINLHDGEGGSYDTKKVATWLKQNNSKLTPAQLASGKDAKLLMKFHTENF